MYSVNLLFIKIMQISELIIIIQNRINSLSNSRAIAANSGDIDAVIAIENQLNDTQITLKQLMTLI